MADVTDFIPYLSFILGFVVIGTMLWNTSKKLADVENQNKNLNATFIDIVKNLKDEYIKEFASIERKHVEDVQALKNEIQRQSLERNDDLSKATLNLSNELNTKQEQLNLLKADVKSLLSKIEVAYTNIASSEKIHDELKAEIKFFLEFITKWSQRIEDRIENLRKEFVHMFSAFHGRGSNNNDIE